MRCDAAARQPCRGAGSNATASLSRCAYAFKGSAAQVERGLPMQALTRPGEAAPASLLPAARTRRGPPFSDVACGAGLDGQAKQQAGPSDKVSNRQERSHQEAKAQSCREPPAAGRGERGCRLLRADASGPIGGATSRFQTRARAGRDIEEEHIYRTVQTTGEGLRQVSARSPPSSRLVALMGEPSGRAGSAGLRGPLGPLGPPRAPCPAWPCPASTHRAGRAQRHAEHAEVFPRQRSGTGFAVPCRVGQGQVLRRAGGQTRPVCHSATSKSL